MIGTEAAIRTFVSELSRNRESAGFIRAIEAHHQGDHAGALAILSEMSSDAVDMESCEVWNLMGLVHLANGSTLEAQRCAEKLSALAQDLKSTRWLGISEVLLSAVNQELGHAAYALDLAKRARAHLEADGTNLDLARATYQLGAVLVVSGKLKDGLRELESAVVLARFSGDTLVEGLAQTRLGFCLVSIGDNSGATRAYERAASQFTAIGSKWRRDRAFFGLCVVRLTCGDTSGAEGLLRELDSSTDDQGDEWRLGRIKLLRGWLANQREDGSKALRELEDAISTFRQLGAQRDEAICLEYIGDALRVLNRNREALDSYDSAAAVGRRVSPTADVVVESLRKSAEVLALEGETVASLLKARAANVLARRLSDRLEIAALQRLRGSLKIARGRNALGLEFLNNAWSAFVQMDAMGEAQSTFALIADALKSQSRRSAEDSWSLQRKVPGLKRRQKSMSREQAELDGIVTQDSRMLRAYRIVLRAAPFELPILIFGETGTGKELFAAIAHKHAQKRGVLLAVNCAALPTDILDAELFGHTRGAYTGAHRDRPGLVEAASDGTLFLDEIGEMTLGVQGRLLRAIEAHEVRRLGENHPRKVNTRFVGATHRDLESMVRDGGFRADLFFRLRGAVVKLPPLRERPGDILLLADHFLSGTESWLGRKVELSEAARATLLAHPWPGNVRELKNVIECSAAMCESGSVITPDDLGLEKIRVAGSLEEHLEDEERRHLTATLESVDWNRSKAARVLRLKRTTLLGKLKRLGIEVPRKK